MKTKYIIASIVLFLGAAIFVGCNKLNNMSDNTRESKDAIIQKFKNVGVTHTKGLEYAFNFIKSKNFSSNNDLILSTNNAVIKYLQSLMDPAYALNIKVAYDQETMTLSNTAKMFKSMSVANDEYFQNNINNSDLSDTTKSFLRNIGAILDNNDDLDKIDSALDSNYSKAFYQITNKNGIYIVAIATIVAKSSAAYWKANLQGWLKYFSTTNNEKAVLNTQSIFSGVGKSVIVL